MLLCLKKNKDSIRSEWSIFEVIKITAQKFIDIYYPEFQVKRQDLKIYTFSEADFGSLVIEDIIFLYEHLSNLTVRHFAELLALDCIKRFMRGQIRYSYLQDFQMALESSSLKVNLTKPQTLIPNLDNFDLYTILSKPRTGVVYPNGEGLKRFMAVEELSKFSEGTIKMVREELQKRKSSHEKDLDTSVKVVQLANLNFVIDALNDKSDYRRSIRRLEKLCGIRKFRRFTKYKFPTG